MPWKSEPLAPSKMNAFLVIPAGVGGVEKGGRASAALFSPPDDEADG